MTAASLRRKSRIDALFCCDSLSRVAKCTKPFQLPALRLAQVCPPPPSTSFLQQSHNPNLHSKLATNARKTRPTNLHQSLFSTQRHLERPPKSSYDQYPEPANKFAPIHYLPLFTHLPCPTFRCETEGEVVCLEIAKLTLFAAHFWCVAFILGPYYRDTDAGPAAVVVVVDVKAGGGVVAAARLECWIMMTEAADDPTAPHNNTVTLRHTLRCEHNLRVAREMLMRDRSVRGRAGRSYFCRDSTQGSREQDPCE